MRRDRAALAALVVVIGAGVLFAVSGITSRMTAPGFSASKAGPAAASLPAPPPSAALETAQLDKPPAIAAGTTAAPVADAAPPAILRSAEANPAQNPAAPASASNTNSVALDQTPSLERMPVAAPSDVQPATPASNALPVSNATLLAPAVETHVPAAATAAPQPATAPVAKPFRVRLAFTADQSKTAAALAQELREKGFEVESITLPTTTGRWPGVAFFFDSDRAKARLIARELTAVTGRNVHARRSGRHPYAKPGTIEVSLVGKSK